MATNAQSQVPQQEQETRSWMILSLVGSTSWVLAVSITDQLILGYSVCLEWVALAVAAVATLLVASRASGSVISPLRAALASFGLGVLAGAGVRIHFGHHVFPISSFCNASAPLIAALFIGIVFAGVAPRETSALNEQLRRKKLGLLYVVVGAMCTAVGNVPSREGSWIFGCCYLAVCGSLGSSAYVIMAVAQDWT